MPTPITTTTAQTPEVKKARKVRSDKGKPRGPKKVAEVAGTTGHAKRATKKKDGVAEKASTKTPGGLCHCGCGETCKPKRLFRQGHDGRFHGRVLKIRNGDLKISELSEVLNVQQYAICFYREEV